MKTSAYAFAGVFVVLLVAGCADNDHPTGAPVDVEWHSGARLRARVLDGGDGAVSFVEWHDTTTGEACTFVRSDDGQMRCLPQFADVSYEDPACEHPVVLRPTAACAATPASWFSYSVPETTDAVCLPPEGLRAGRLTHPSTASAFYYKSYSGCAPLSDNSADWFSLEPVPLDEFVGSHETVGEPVGGLASVTREADDGSSQVVRVLAISTEQPCSPRSARTGVRRCVPSEHVAWRTGHYFADPACTDPVAYSWCDVPDIVYSDDRGDCSDSHVFSLGQKIEGTAYEGYSGTCKEATSPSQVYYRFGDESFDVFPKLEDIDVGRGRIVARRWGTQSVPLGPWSRLVDTSTASDCLVIHGNDVRCGRTYYDVVQQSGAYSDAACTTPLLGWGQRLPAQGGDGGPQCDSPPIERPPPTLAITSTDACEVPEYHELGDEWPGAVYTLDTSSICVATERDAGIHYVLPGPTVPLGSFPLLVDRIE